MEVFDTQGNKIEVGDKVEFIFYYSGKIPKYLTEGWAEIIKINNKGTIVYQHSYIAQPRRVSKDIFAACARLIND